MPKYSTGGSSGGGDAGACELCGSTADDLRTASVAGATLDVCPDCAPHDDATESGGSGGGGDDDSDADRRKRAAQNVAKMGDVTGDSAHWEEDGTDYEADRLPYLVSDYGARVERARQEAGYQRDELASELDVDENVLLAVEQGRATRAGVGGSVVRALEDALDVDLVDE